MRAILEAIRAWFQAMRERRARQIAIQDQRVRCAALYHQSHAAMWRDDWKTYVRLRCEYRDELLKLEAMVNTDRQACV